MASFGVDLVEKRVLGDDVDQVAGAIAELLERVDVVVVTGGLGPTADDITREAIARALGRELRHDHEVEGWVRARYEALGRAVPSIAGRMARVVDGTRPLPNSRGAAPGLMVMTKGRLLAAFPGVPWEMEEMLTRDLAEELAALNPGARRVTRELLLGGVMESDAEVRVCHLYDRFGRENISILASYGTIRLVLSATGEAVSAARRVDEMEAAFRGVLGADVAGVDLAGLEGAVVRELARRGETLATAESCTGGLLGAALTEVPGVSEWYVGGVVSYSNELKERLLGVPHELLVDHGAVSEPVARGMARGVRERLGAAWGVGVTGVAGPGGGTMEKPVGLVHWAIAGPAGEWAGRQVFPGSRDVVRRWAVNAALDSLRRRLIGGTGS
jgi:nicotinamide-nucleotide amidase